MIDIVIVNWNSHDFLRKCVLSIFNSKQFELISNVIIIDNNSMDDSLQLLPTHAKLKVVKNSQNLGFAKACNQGFKTSQSKYILLLNPDAVLLDNTISASFDYMETHNDVDVLGCQLLNESNQITPTCARFPKAINFVYHSLGLSKIWPKLFHPPTLMTDWDHKESRFVDQVMGAYMFMRNIVFEKSGYFDERFFVYFEELDFSLSLRNAGGKSFYHSGIQAIHTGMGTTGTVKAFRLFLSLNSRLKYAKKHFSMFGYLTVAFFTFTIEFLMRFLQLALKGNLSETKNLVKGYWMLLGRKKFERL
ncbi:MAG: glycosyltransferase family 2 protein [Sphingobacteriales bacterium]|nr:glycosyltransferase family 2 protein [Sphingobacteriales bacterium]